MQYIKGVTSSTSDQELKSVLTRTERADLDLDYFSVRDLEQRGGNLHKVLWLGYCVAQGPESGSSIPSLLCELHHAVCSYELY